MDELIDRLRARAAAHGGDKLLEEAAAALEAAREDAARYRWLRDVALDTTGTGPAALMTDGSCEPAIGGKGWRSALRGPQLDAAIDQARGKGVADA